MYKENQILWDSRVVRVESCVRSSQILGVMALVSWVQWKGNLSFDGRLLAGSAFPHILSYH